MLLPPPKLRLFVVAILIALSLSVFLYRVLRPLETSIFTKVTREVVLPVQYLLRASLINLVNTWKRYIFLIGREEENMRLREENAHLRDQVVSLTSQKREYQLEAQRLHKLLAMNIPTEHRGIIVRVISRVQSPLSRHIFIDQGSERGIKVGMPVVTEAGLAGRITETSQNLSKVMLITDRLSRVDVVTQDARLSGILQGTGSADCLLKYIARDEAVNEGDLVLTSRLSNFFPHGLPVGRISRLGTSQSDMFKEIYVRPVVDLARLEEVVVLVPVKGTQK